MYVEYSGPAVARYGVLADIHYPVLLAGDWINRYFAYVISGDQIIERLRKPLFVCRVLVDHFAQSLEVLLEYCLASLRLNMLICGDADSRQDYDDGHHHDQFEQCEPAGIADWGLRIADW